MSRPIEIALDMSAPETLPLETARQVRAEFQRLVREHAPALFRLAIRLGARRDDAEDLVQETFLRAWRGIDRFRGEADVRTWLYRILMNASRDRRRRKPFLRLPANGRAGPGVDPADDAARRDLLARVMAAVSCLPRRQQETLLLRVRGGLSYREIADVLGIREGVVKLHLVRARKKLLRRFGREAAEWGIA
jgi:RNA polymerase sigma-70 factor (ECF subfamily)